MKEMIQKIFQYVAENWEMITATGMGIYEIIARVFPTAKSYTLVRLIVWILTHVDKLQIKKK